MHLFSRLLVLLLSELSYNAGKKNKPEGGWPIFKDGAVEVFPFPLLLRPMVWPIKTFARRALSRWKKRISLIGLNS